MPHPKDSQETPAHNIYSYTLAFEALKQVIEEKKNSGDYSAQRFAILKKDIEDQFNKVSLTF